jgi:integrase/recombinase XerD
MPYTVQTKPTLTDDYEICLANFRRELEDRGGSVHTIRLYTSGAERFLRYLAEDLGNPLPLDSISKEHAREWLRKLRTDGLKPASIRSLHQAARAFFALMQEDGETRQNPLDGLTLPKMAMKDVAIINPEDMRALLKAAESGRGVWRERDVAILLTLYDGGLRASELIGLKPQDIDWREGAAFVNGKGNRPRRVGLGNKTLRALRKYLNARTEWERKRPEYMRLPADAPIWLSHKGAGERTLTDNALRRIVTELARAAGLEDKNLTPHSFRHSAASYKAGQMNESELRASFGWTANSAQVFRYTRSNLEQRAVVSSRKASPADKL